MPGAIRREPLHTRTGRAQASLRLSPQVIQRLTETPPLRNALNPFRTKFPDALSATAFIHSFGCSGPTDGQWRDLFASVGALRPEDLSVIISYIVCPDDMEQVVFGSPGILDHVCRLWDEWLVDEVLRRTSEAVDNEAAHWDMRKSSEGLVWGTFDNRNHSSTVCSLGQSVNVIAHRIVKDVARYMFGQVLERVSFGGQDAFAQMLDAKGNMFVGLALSRAKTVLVERVFGTSMERNCYAV